MSWILRRKKKVTALLVSVLLLTPAWYLVPVIWLLLIIYSPVNRRFNRWNATLSAEPWNVLSFLHKRDEIKPIDTLVIGDTCTQELLEKYKLGNSLEIQFPDRGLLASRLIFMHVESVLEEHGRLIILHDKNTTREKLSIYDIPYLHAITLKELKLESKAKSVRYPLILEPVKSIKYLLGIKKTGYHEAKCPIPELVSFCNERRIDLIYLTNT